MFFQDSDESGNLRSYFVDFAHKIKEILRNLINSLFWFRAAPSAIFDGIDTAALRNWLVRQKSSDFGKALV